MFWTNFFHRITPFVKGPEKGAVANDTAVILCAIQKLQRGHYNLAFELLTEQPRTMPAGSITKTYVEFAERNIRLHPDNYLWSHRRWKWQFEERFRDSLL